MAGEAAGGFREAFRRVLAGEGLSVDAAEAAMSDIMAGHVPEGAIAGYVVALRLKRETPDEVVGSARAMRAASARIYPRRAPIVDTCGTGGDESGTVNLSTGAALVVAAGGAAVAKHGNRSVSSKCGSADVLEALGIPVDAEPSRVQRLVDELGFGFLFSPRFHPAMRHAMGARRALATRTMFNLLGPMTNPAGATRQVMGVYGENVLDLAAEALRGLGTEHAFILHSSDGTDEFSLSAPTHVIEVTPGRTTRTMMSAEQIGVREAKREALRGGDAAQNAAALEKALRGEAGPVSDAIVANASFAFVVAGLAEDPREGVERARATIQRGNAFALVERLRQENRA